MSKEIKITIAGDKYAVPTAIEHIELGTFELIYNNKSFDPVFLDTINGRSHLFSVLTGIPIDLILDEMQPHELDTLYAVAVNAINKETVNSLLDDSKSFIVIDDVRYQLQDDNDITLREWASIESIMADDSNHTKLSDVLSVLLRPIGEKYNSDNDEGRKSLFQVQGMNKIFPVVGFFLSKGEEYKKTLAYYTQIKEATAQGRGLLNDFVITMDGIESLTNWQRITFYIFRKYSTYILSK